MRLSMVGADSLLTRASRERWVGGDRRAVIVTVHVVSHDL